MGKGGSRLDHLPELDQLPRATPHAHERDGQEDAHVQHAPEKGEGGDPLPPLTTEPPCVSIPGSLPGEDPRRGAWLRPPGPLQHAQPVLVSQLPQRSLVVARLP